MLGAADVGATSMPGGLSPVPTDDPGVVNAMRAAEEYFNRRSNDEFYSMVSNVTSAETEVVAGFLYYLTLELRTTVCRKSSLSQDCPFHEDPQYAKMLSSSSILCFCARCFGFPASTPFSCLQCHKKTKT
ncbi:cystatin-2-like [Mobula hypostoma]|uniref:cystatin-2-like n=1 Tax=Mobula hypostoma TaxID=723540 RepID=UPI002FC275E7